ncbi:Zn(2)-C6 fungal-type domain-containing protein [Plasmodiophora brassicae]|uniref:Zn(2)-C6 fungal-type domain-containing protein n=1 Tax=Plasmodiophora brassicae TaxID=37360 RepID=A0A0G4J1A6_PLABS|nr:hypothetical protein PBRA_002024 [Plasmodiophora brassicae]
MSERHKTYDTGEPCAAGSATRLRMRVSRVGLCARRSKQPPRTAPRGLGPARARSARAAQINRTIGVNNFGSTRSRTRWLAMHHQRKPKTCETCWLRRTRCDGRRPCERCQRLLIPDCRDRDYPDGQDRRESHPRVERACPPCAAGKVRCETDRPCRRCIRRGIATRCCGIAPVWYDLAIVSSFLTMPIAQPESLTCFFRSAHHMFTRDVILCSDVQAYLRQLGAMVLKPHDLRAVEDDITSGVSWNETVPLPVITAGSASGLGCCRPMVIFTAVIPGDGSPTVRVATPNPSASVLLGYSQQDMTAATAEYNSRPHGEFLSPFFKLFHPASWPTVAWALCRVWLFGWDAAEFGRVTLLRKDARPVDAFVSMTIRKHVCTSPRPSRTTHFILDINTC